MLGFAHLRMRRLRLGRRPDALFLHLFQGQQQLAEVTLD
ncbi:hypothetical protein J3R74_000534 [Puniceicoccus vermicola]